MWKVCVSSNAGAKGGGDSHLNRTPCFVSCPCVLVSRFKACWLTCQAFCSVGRVGERSGGARRRPGRPRRTEAAGGTVLALVFRGEVREGREAARVARHRRRAARGAVIAWQTRTASAVFACDTCLYGQQLPSIHETQHHG
eukprot:3128793-Pleurochrysis_carterae.AAC.2